MINGQIQIPKPLNPEGRARLIVKGFGLPIIREKAFAGFIGTPEQSLLDAPDKIGKFGLPVWDTITISGSGQNGAISYVDDNGTTISAKPLVLETCLIEVNQVKNIVKTEIAGRNGTIKEYISDGDFVINIKGAITGSGNADEYPTNEVRNLITACSAPVELDISSRFLLEFGVKSIVIEQYNFPQNEGIRNVQFFELNCVSETPFVIRAVNEGVSSKRTATAFEA